MRRIFIVALVAVATLLVVPVTARAGGAPPCPPGTAPDPQGLACVFLDKVSTGLDAQTSAPAAQDPWLTQALELQHRLGDPLPLRDAMWVGTHNSFNSAANVPPSLSNTDSNQHLSMVQQLDLGIRSLEVDIHWILNRVVVCHGRPESELNAGCTYERLLADELAPIASWIRAHPGDVVLLYVEDDVTSAAAYSAAADTIGAAFGPLLYRPQGGGCPLLPLDLHRTDVLAAGAQVVVMSGCGSGAVGAWGSTVFDDSVRAEEGNPDFHDCTSPSVPLSAYGTKLVRFYEDSTFVSAAVAVGDPGHRFTTETLQAMVSCGVNLYGLDQLDPNDSRLAALVWSWAPNEPSAAGSCAVDGSDGRFHAASCVGVHPYACVDPAGNWFVGADGCASGRFAVPRNGPQAEALRAAKARAGVDTVWVDYRRVDGTWSASQ